MAFAPNVAQAAPHSDEFVRSCNDAVRFFGLPGSGMSKTHQLKSQLDMQNQMDMITGRPPAPDVVADRQAGVLTAYNTGNCSGPANTKRPAMHSEGWYTSCEAVLSTIGTFHGPTRQQGFDTLLDQVHRGNIGHGDPQAEPGARAAFDHNNCD